MYKVDYHAPFWNDYEEKYTTDRVYTFPDLKSGTRYNFSVRVVAGNNESDPVFAYAVTGKETTFCLFMKQTFGFVIYVYFVS